MSDWLEEQVIVELQEESVTVKLLLLDETNCATELDDITNTTVSFVWTVADSTRVLVSNL